MESPVFDVTAAEFEQRVLERSKDVPVVVDFWAEWCAPCRMLGPVLEREVAALGGRVLLAKLDTDQNPEISERFEIRGIPSVKAFRDGKVVAEFTGAREAMFLRTWLSGLSPSPAVEAVGRAQTEAELRPLLSDAQAGAKAALKLAPLLLAAGRVEEALTVLDGVTALAEEYPAAQAMKQQAGFVADAAAYGGEAPARAALAVDEKDSAARWALACALVARGETAGALEEFLALVARDRKFRDDGARKAMLVLFEALGPTSELPRAFRRRLQIVM